MGLDQKGIKTTLKTLHKYIKTNKQGTCQGCSQGSRTSQICSISNCVKAKGYWTCAECKDYNPESENPCPHVNSRSMPIADKGQFMKMIYTRYNRDPAQNLKNCRDVGYLAFIKNVKEKVANGWRTWQIISKEMVFTNENSKK